MRWLCFPLLVAIFATVGITRAQDRKLTPEERVELIRGLTAEYAKAKAQLPRSKGPLIFPSTGKFDEKTWSALDTKNGTAARVGDLVQITKVQLEDKRIVFEINGGANNGPKWYQRIQIGVGTQTSPVGSTSQSVAPSGTTLALVFPGRLPPLKAAEVKALLAPVLDFNMRTPTEAYIEKLPPPIQEAIKKKKAVEGMDRDQVLLAMGRPDNKVRTTVDDTEYEDWIYGSAPGRIVFVTFEGNEVVRVKEDYAGLGGSVAPPLPSPR